MSESKRKNTTEPGASAGSTDGVKHHSEAPRDGSSNASSDAEPDFVTKVATVGIIGVGVALIEVSLIPGMLIGLAAAFAPKYAPKVTDGLRPLLRGTVRGAVKLAHKTRDVIAEASEQVQDIVAEAKLEDVEEAHAFRSAVADASATKV
jgi:hypothetical protein